MHVHRSAILFCLYSTEKGQRERLEGKKMGKMLRHLESTLPTNYLYFLILFD